MPRPQTLAFSIDDAQGVEENLQALQSAIGQVDEELATVLKEYLSAAALGRGPDLATLWDELFAATAASQAEGATGDDA